jgi:hypothetical protein
LAFLGIFPANFHSDPQDFHSDHKKHPSSVIS